VITYGKFVYLGAAFAALVLNGCAEPDDPPARAVAATLQAAADDADSGTAGPLCGNGFVDGAEECDPSALGWREVCDANCQRNAYEPCTDSVAECGGNNALCASYAAEVGSQFCADFCKTAADCPVLPGFRAECNLAWCAVLCDFGRCPAGMTCLRDVELLDFAGNSRGSRDVCIVSAQ
jgi:hypothetical protein